MVEQDTTKEPSPNRRIVTSSPFRIFIISSAAGALALIFNFLLRLASLAPYPPESALESVLRIIPESIQEPSVQRLGDFAGQLGLIVASLVAVVIYGVLGLVFQRLVYPKISRVRTISIFEGFILYSPLPFFLFGVILLLIFGDSLFGLASPFVSSYSIVFFPLSLLFVQLLYSLALYYFVRANFIQPYYHREKVLPLARKTDGEMNFRERNTLSRRAFLQKAVISAGVLALTTYSLDRIISSFSIPSASGPTGTSQQSSAIDLSGAPAIFSDPRLASLVDNEITPNSAFYRVAIDIIDPQVDSSTWSLQIAGSVQNPTKSYTLNDLQNSFPAVDEYDTFECVSNEINGNLIGNAKWTGVRISDVLNGSGGIESGAQFAVFYSIDGYSVAIPISKALETESILAYMMNDQVLPQKHGYPLRAVIPGLYGMMSAKWVTKIEIVNSPFQGYWQSRGWSPTGIVQTVSFITIPGSQQLSLSKNGGTVIIGGMAYAGDRGISKVEVSVDGGNTWKVAELKKPLSNDTWALWAYEWTPSSTGSFNVYARATDGSGSVQTANSTNTFPSGATGYATASVTVSS